MPEEKMKSMYEHFLDNEEIPTKELIGIGFTSSDLGKLVESGKLERVRRGYYKLISTEGLSELYAEYCKKKDFARAAQVAKRYVDIEPNNLGFNLVLLFNAINEKDYDQVFKCFDILFSSKDRTLCYERDYNLWLFMLSFVTELPERYKERVKNIKFENVTVSHSDRRYSDYAQENRIRRKIITNSFQFAMKLINENRNKKNIYTNITTSLCFLANIAEVQKKIKIQTLVCEERYQELLDLLAKESELHGLSIIEKTIYGLVNDLLSMEENKKIPDMGVCESDAINEAIQKRDYEKALQLSEQFTDKFRSGVFPVLLKRILSKVEEIRQQKEADVVSREESVVIEMEKEVLANAEKVNFSQIVSSLMNKDIDEAFNLLNKYLEELGKTEYRGVVVDLIKLSLLNKDMAFVDPMFVLAKISRDDWNIDVSVYIQDFYLNLVDKEYKKAAIYLDIIAMSSTIGLVAIDTTDMKRVLIEDAKRAGLSAQDLGIVDDLSQSVDEAASTISSNDEEPVVVDEVASSDEEQGTVDDSEVEQDANERLEEMVSESAEEVGTEEQRIVEDDSDEITYSLVDVIADVLEDTNLVMLEPMSDEEIRKVLEVTRGVQNIQTKVIEDVQGEKHVVLRYVDKGSGYVDVSAVLREANKKFKNWEYVGAINLYQSILPKLDNPKGFIYGNLGLSYQKTTYDGDYSKAIDYLSMAIYESSHEEKFLDYTKLIEQLKKKTGYNGVNITAENGDSDEKSGAPQLRR